MGGGGSIARSGIGGGGSISRRGTSAGVVANAGVVPLKKSVARDVLLPPNLFRRPLPLAFPIVL